jgi:hypothetical protein
MRTYFLAVGLIFLALALSLLVRRLAVLLHGVSVAGRVEGHEKRTLDDAAFFVPIVSFVDQSEHSHQFTSVAGSSSKYPPVGAEVRVRYLRANPNVAFIESFLHMWAAPVACAALGLGALAAALP